MNDEIKPQRRQITVADMIVARPMQPDLDEVFREWKERRKLPSIEETGRGNTICCFGWSGRLFRADPGGVKENVEKFIDDYYADCQRSDEDPANYYNEEYDLNKLYCLVGIVPTHFGHNFLYETSKEWAQDIDVNYEMVYPGDSEVADAFGEPVYIIEPANMHSYPHERNLEY